MEVWVQMYEDYPMYYLSSYGNVRKCGTNKNLKITLKTTRKNYDGFEIVHLRDKNNLKKWVQLSDLMKQYFTREEIIVYNSIVNIPFKTGIKQMKTK